MASPTVRGSGTPSNQTDMVPAKAVTAPTRAVGDLLICFASADTTTTAITFGGTYTSLYEEATGTTTRHGAAWRIATNDANDDTTFAATNTQDGSAVIFAITTGTHGVTQTSDIIVAAQATGASGNADPPSADGGSVNDWLAMAHCTVDMTATGDSISAAPTNYTTGAVLTKSASSTSSVGLGVAYRELTATQTENPGTFTNTSRAWQAKTILIPPVPPAPTFPVLSIMAPRIPA